jgi:acetyl-CoA carboxylase carboxyltransferase component
MASAEVPRFTVVLRKAYAAGYYAMCAPGFEPRATLALPTATIGTMAPEASANAMYANRIAQIEDPGERAAFVARRVAEQEAEVNLLRMGSDLVVDAVVDPGDLRAELIARVAAAEGWQRSSGTRHHVVSPV